MNRRDILTILPSAALGLLLGSRFSNVYGNYRTNTFSHSWVKGSGNTYDLVADGKAISDDCFSFDTRTGDYQCYTRNADGDFFIIEGTGFVAMDPVRTAKHLELIPK